MRNFFYVSSEHFATHARTLKRVLKDDNNPLPSWKRPTARKTSVGRPRRLL